MRAGINGVVLYGNMFRTKDLFLVMILCVGLVLIGIFLMSRTEPLPVTVIPLTQPLIAAPYRDSYGVLLKQEEREDAAREAFIEKIRREYADQVPPKQTEPTPSYAPYVPPVYPMESNTTTPPLY